MPIYSASTLLLAAALWAAPAMGVAAAGPLGENATKAQEEARGQARELEAVADQQAAEGRWQEALEVSMRAVELIEAQLGPGEVALCTALQRVAAAQLGGGQPEQAQLTLDRALDIAQPRLGSFSEPVASLLALRAQAFAAQGQPGRAAQLEREVRMIARRLLHPPELNLMGLDGRIDPDFFHVSPGGGYLALGMGEAFVVLAAETGQPLRRFPGKACGFRGEGQVLSCTSREVTAWDLRTGAAARHYAHDLEGSYGLAVSEADGELILYGGGDIVALDLLSGRSEQIADGCGWVSSLSVDAEGRLLTYRTPGSVTVLDRSSREAVLTVDENWEDSFSLSPGGSLLLTDERTTVQGPHTLRLRDAQDGAIKWEIREVDGFDIMWTRPVAFSPDGGTFVAALCLGRPVMLSRNMRDVEDSHYVLQLRDTATGAVLRSMDMESGLPRFRWAADGDLFLAWSNAVSRWRSEDWSPTWERRSAVQTLAYPEYSGRGRMLALDGAPGDGERILRLGEGTTWSLPADEGERGISPDGHLLLTYYQQRERTLRVWDTATARPLLTLDAVLSPEWWNDQAILADRALLVGRLTPPEYQRFSYRVWDLDSGELRCEAETPSKPLGLQLSAGGEVVTYRAEASAYRFSGRRARRLVQQDCLTGRSRRGIQLPRDARIEWAEDGSQLARQAGDGGIELLDPMEQRAPLRLDPPPGYDATGWIWFARDGTHLTAECQEEGATGSALCVWDLANQRRICRDLGVPAQDVAASEILGDHVLVARIGWGTLRFWDLDSGLVLATLLVMRDGSWLVVDPEGRFDTSGGVAESDWSWVLETPEGPVAVGFGQLSERYYEPDLLRRTLGFSDDPLREVGDLVSPPLFPDLVLAGLPTPERPAFDLLLTDRGGGIGRVRVAVNGKELSADARPPGSEPTHGELAFTVDLSAAPGLLRGQENRVEIVAFNDEGWLSSPPVTTTFVGPPPGAGARGVRVLSAAANGAPAPPPRLFAVVVGTADYRADALDLRYPGQDAAALGLALARGGAELFEEVSVRSLLDDPAAVAEVAAAGLNVAAPTRAGILAALEEVAAASRPEDVLVVYLAGHGVTWRDPVGASEWYYLTHDAASGALSDPEVRARVAISSDQLTRALTAVPALKQILILDACEAGAMLGAEVQARASRGDRTKALERMKDRAGIFEIASSAGGAASYESRRLQHGLLTHSLLEGMRGAALRDGRYWDVGTLFEYAADRVPSLAGDIGARQAPEFWRPHGGPSFDFGLATAGVRDAIQLAEPLPVIGPAAVLDQGTLGDPRGLGAHIDDALRSLGDASEGAGLLVLADDRWPGAYHLGGLYRLEAGRLVLSLRLSRDGVLVAEDELDVAEGQDEELAGQVAAWAARTLVEEWRGREGP